MTLQMTTLDNGLRVVTDTVTSVDSVALGAYFAVGTRHETMEQNGLAHLVEHMMFKGTGRRTASQIAETIEGIGGHMNAYTGREVTGYYFHVLKDHVPLTLDVLADMIQGSVFDPKELERERGVILQEIGMTADTPDDLIYDVFQTVAYPGQTLGAPILGDVERVTSMPRSAIIDYVRQFYTPARLIISAAGHIDHDDFVAQVVALFTALPANTQAAYRPAAYQGGEDRRAKDLEQAHLMLGYRGIARTDPRYYQAVALAHILGGGMSSRLFQEVRERRGLAYSIHAFHSAYRDDGTLAIYAGTGETQVAELIGAVTDILSTYANSISEAEVTRTQQQLRANLLMARESMATRADQNAKHLMFHDRLFDADELRARITALTPANIGALAREILATPLTLAALGPIDQLPAYEKINR
jgi:predicted Zn-dependent peptidase